MKPILSISILASRNIKEVRRCLDSLKPIMDAIPSELIIVDTSKDATVRELCLSYTEHVLEFTWCNDFSKARNVGLKEAKGEWFLFIDDDEWFVETKELIDFFSSGEYKKYACANYIQRNFHDHAWTFYSDKWVSRIIKLCPETHFESKIHEYLIPQLGNGKNIHAIANHTGYIVQTQEERLKKFERNYPLLCEMMAEEPQLLRWRVQIVQELHNVKKWKELESLCEESIAFTLDRTDWWDLRDVGTFYAGLLISRMNLGKYAEAEELYEATKKDKRLTKLCRVYLTLHMGQVYFRMREWKKAEEQLKLYMDGVEYFDVHVEEREMQEDALLIGGALDEVLRKRAISLRIGCALMQGDTSILQRDYHLLGWGKPVMYVADDFFPILVEAMVNLPEEPVLLQAMSDLWGNSESAMNLFATIEGYREKNEEAFKKLFRMTAKVEANPDNSFWYLWYAKLIVADWDCADVDYTGLFCGFCKNTPDVFLTPENIIGIVKRHGGSLEAGYCSLSFDKWKEQLEEYVGKVSFSEILLTERELQQLNMQDNLRCEYALMWLARSRMVKGTDYETIQKGLVDYGTRAAEIVDKYYQPVVVEEYPDILSHEILAGLYLNVANAVGSKSSGEEMYYLDRAAQVDDALSDSLVEFLQKREAWKADSARRAKEELREIEKNIKAEVHKRLESGKYTEAMEILTELRKMKPNDLEVMELVLRARLGMLEEEITNEKK